jgi:hypothetical protein
MQYKRINSSKKRLYGIPNEPVWQHTLLATLHGILGGLVGSFVMVLVGISISDIGIGFLWVVAIALMFISPRFLCFSYAGTIIALSYMIFGWPEVEVAQLMGLVAILHLVESFLILISGHLGAIAVYTKNSQGQTVGAFSMQKFWPIPIVVLMLVESLQPGATGDVLKTPDWWPILKPLEGGDDYIYAIIPVMAGLGYGDVAITMPPQQKSRHSAAILAVYSIVLLFLSIIASRAPYLNILPALFGALGHEITIWIGKRNQLRGIPFYVSPERGVKVLDVLRESLASRIGIKSGDIIYSINGVEVNNRYELQEILEEVTIYLEIEYLKGQSNTITREVLWRRNNETIGIIPAPEQNDRPHVHLSTQGILLRWFKKIKH